MAPLALWFVLGRTVASVTWMSSASMSPTLRADPSDGVLVDRLSPRLRAPERGEIVFFPLPDGQWVMKRVMGLPGDRISIAAGRVVANDRPVELPAVARISYVNAGHLASGVTLQVKPGFYFVLGDDSSDSYDSRYWGCLAATEIRGYARAIVWPPARARFL